MSELTIGEVKGHYPALVELTRAEGDLAYRARIELLTLWGVFDPPDESAELTRLRGIERACIEPLSREEAIEWWRDIALESGEEWGTTFCDIADALEVE